MKHAFVMVATLALLVAGGAQARAGLYSGPPISPGPHGSGSADPLIAFSFADFAGDGATGILTASSLGGGDYLATGGAVIVDGPAAGIYTIVPGGPAAFSIPGFLVDNVIYTTSNPILDTYGLALVSGTTYLNIWGTGPDTYSFYTYNTATSSYVVTNTGLAAAAAVVISTIPEPSTMTIAATGGISFIFIAYRKRRRRAA